MTPVVTKVEGATNPPTVTIVKIEAVEGWEKGFYIKLESVLNYEDFGGTWNVFLNPESDFPFALRAQDINDRYFMNVINHHIYCMLD